MNTIAQVVQHLRPGGIETMALDLLDFCDANETCYIVSLEGTKEQAICAWPRLSNYRDRLIFLDKQPGFSLPLIGRLMRIFKTLGVNYVHSHHIGPLIYGGVAARLARANLFMHTEHDSWHLDNTYQSILERLAIFITRPFLVADAKIVAQKMIEKLKHQDITIIPNGIDTNRFVARPPRTLPQAI